MTSASPNTLLAISLAATLMMYLLPSKNYVVPSDEVPTGTDVSQPTATRSAPADIVEKRLFVLSDLPAPMPAQVLSATEDIPNTKQLDHYTLLGTVVGDEASVALIKHEVTQAKLLLSVGSSLGDCLLLELSSNSATFKCGPDQSTVLALATD